MLVFIGYLIILLASIGTYAVHGSLLVLWVPMEYLAIVGLMIGGFVSSNDTGVMKGALRDAKRAFGKSRITKEFYTELFSLLYLLLQKIKKEGLMAIEFDIEKPNESSIFKKYPEIMKDHHVIDFICDYLRMMNSGNLNSFEIESLMDAELQSHHAETHKNTSAITKVSDALPAFGIVVAVMGVVNVMSSVGEPPEILGKMIGGALVGTFLGILLAYGFVGPVSAKMESRASEESNVLECIKTILLANMNGYPPPVSIEFGRKATSPQVRPSFVELDESIRKLKSQGVEK